MGHSNFIYLFWFRCYLTHTQCKIDIAKNSNTVYSNKGMLIKIVDIQGEQA